MPDVEANPTNGRARSGSLNLPGGTFGGYGDATKAHEAINYWTDKELLAWRDGYVSSCAAIAVAAAIFASIGLSSLSLPEMDKTHWTARAFLTSSMSLGIMSVMSATTHLQAVGILNKPLEIRLWLSRCPSSNGLPLESSMPKRKSLGLPQLWLNIAVILYFVGFGLYFLFRWLQIPKPNEPDNPLDSRNIFIFYTAVTCTSFIFTCILWFAQHRDEKLAKKKFDPPDKCQVLEVQLRSARKSRALPYHDESRAPGDSPLLEQLVRVLDALDQKLAKKRLTRRTSVKRSRLSSRVHARDEHRHVTTSRAPPGFTSNGAAGESAGCSGPEAVSPQSLASESVEEADRRR